MSIHCSSITMSLETAEGWRSGDDMLSLYSQLLETPKLQKLYKRYELPEINSLDH
ncbi:unnamed protein product [Penicillium salamii]|nr:unnamed protein product [Penicillium salamii]